VLVAEMVVHTADGTGRLIIALTHQQSGGTSEIMLSQLQVHDVFSTLN
jgi:hypothetical protein